MKKTCLIPLLLIVFFSCKNQPEITGKLVTFENALDYNENTISFESARFVKLENIEDAYIGEEVKMKTHEGKIYIMDDQTQKNLLCFDSQGNFINKIGQKGNGPEEYLNLYDFCLKEDTVELLVRNKNSAILKYLSNGNFVNRLDLKQRAMAIEYSPESGYLIGTGYTNQHENSRIYNLDNNGNVLKSYLKNKGELVVDMVDPGDSFFKIEEFILYCESFNDTIYSINNNGLRPKYIMDFGSFTNSRIDVSDFFKSIQYGMKILNDGLSSVTKCYENEDYVLISYDFNKEGKTKMYYLLYNKKKEHITTLISNEDNFLMRKFLGLTKDNEIAFMIYPYGKEQDELKQLIPNVTIPQLSEKDNAMIAFLKISKEN